MLMVAMLGLGAVLARDRVEDRVVPAAPAVASTPSIASLDDRERAFYDYVAPRILAVSAEAAVLAELGGQRSRNLIELQVRSDRVTAVSRELDAYMTNVPTPARFAPAMALYHEGVAALVTGMDEARAAFFQFDWDALGAALDRFSGGAGLIDQSYSLLTAEAGVATPVATPSGYAERGAG